MVATRGTDKFVAVSLSGAKLRAQIVKSRPTVKALSLCPKAEAEKYRAGAEAFIDRLFCQEEIEECLIFFARPRRRNADGHPRAEGAFTPERSRTSQQGHIRRGCW